MPTARFTTVVVARENPESEQQAIANTSRYLAYGDQTDTFGYHAHVSEVRVALDEDAVVFVWEAPVSAPHNIRDVEEEFDHLSRVRSHECVSNPVNANL